MAEGTCVCVCGGGVFDSTEEGGGVPPAGPSPTATPASRQIKTDLEAAQQRRRGPDSAPGDKPAPAINATLRICR